MIEIKKNKHLPFMLLFGGVLLYSELIFRLATIGISFDLGLLCIPLFSIAYGMAGYLLASISKKPLVNRIISAVFLGGTALIYVVQFLIHKQFKVFYDINTMFGGAGDALSSYFSELMTLIFLKGGIFIILLLFLPFALYLIFGNKHLPAHTGSLRSRLYAGGTALGAYLLALVLIFTNSVFGAVYSEQYNFQSAVADFGLISGLRLDLQNALFGKEISFEQADIPTVSIPGEEEQQTPEAPIEYGYNSIELDFEALNQKATDAQKKLNDYVSTLTPSKKNQYTGLFKGKNMIMITAEAFSAEVIDPTLTPTLYRLANKGIQFTDYYQPASAGTTGGEYQNIFGLLPTSGGKSFKNTVDNLNYYTLGSQLDRLGYYGQAFHNNSHTYYSRNETHNNIGYSEGFMGKGNGMEQYVKSLWPQSDYEMISGTLPTFIDRQPFNVYYMTVSGHSNYSVGENDMTKRHWDKVQHLPYSDTVKGYIAANLDLEDAMAHLVSELEKKGIADDTVICISSDHFPYGLDSDAALGQLPYLSELYGYEVDDYFERDHSRLILWSGCLEKNEPIVVSSPTSSMDILPTLSNLFGTEFDSRLMPGRDVLSDAPALYFNSHYDWKTDLGTYYASKGTFVPVREDLEIPEDYVKTIKAVVRNKMNYCSGVLDTDYFRLLFG
ncbi:MAG: sulfatase-like hydrolase/transferase [Clostridia bacterium]|nr:sulfatase-like hydrolase/transferase [Clostridia bacterium]